MPSTQRAKPAKHVDRGTSGPAMAGRPTRLTETLEDGVRAQPTLMDDADPLNAMNLTRLQVDVAAYLRDLWRDCLPGIELPGGYGNGAGHGGQRHLTADEEAAAKRAWWDYRRAMDYLAHNAGRAAEQAVIGAVIRDERAHPPLVRCGLDMLAYHWRMK